MDYFRREVPWAVWQFGLLKLSMIAFGIIVGALFADFWRPWVWMLWAFVLVTMAWIALLWRKAIRRSPVG